MKVNLQATLPLWVSEAIKPFCSFHHMIGEKEDDLISNLIEEERYEEAELLIEQTEKKWGVTVHTVKLSTRIARIRCIGK